MSSSDDPALERELFGPSRAFAWGFRFSIAGSLALIVLALHHWGAREVRSNAGNILFLAALGAGWLLLTKALFPWLGLDPHDDVVERRNPAALFGLCGAVLSVALTFAGGNLGEGSSFWNNVFSAALGTCGLFALWLLLEAGAQVSSSIAEERDLASGFRLCGFLVAVGLILGRATAGDWHSMSATFHDFLRDGWPAALLCGIALFIERFTRPRPQRPFPSWVSYGLLPALLYLALAFVWLWHLGSWEGMPL